MWMNTGVSMNRLGSRHPRHHVACRADPRRLCADRRGVEPVERSDRGLDRVGRFDG
jgi:hypothetical protein